MHLEVIFQLLMCGPDAAITPVVCTSGLEIEFYPNLALMVAVVAFPLCMDVVEVMVVRMVQFFLTRDRHRMTP